MACKHCGSKNQQMIEAELSACYPRIEDLRQSPIYVCQRSLICLDCGYIDLRVPTAELEQLTRGISMPGEGGRRAPGSTLSYE